jgi:hypothetical protein
LNLQAFCYLALVKFPEQLEPSLALLAQAEKEECEKFVATIRELPKSELLQRWAALRFEESTRISRGVFERCGVQFDDLPPAVGNWWAAWLERQHG